MFCLVNQLLYIVLMISKYCKNQDDELSYNYYQYYYYSFWLVITFRYIHFWSCLAFMYPSLISFFQCYV